MRACAGLGMVGVAFLAVTSTTACGGSQGTADGASPDAGADDCEVWTPPADGSTPSDVPATPDVPAPPPDVPGDAALVTPGDPGAAEVRLTVNTGARVAPISPYIYGWNGPDWSRAQGVTFARMGGNRMTAYNWVTNASNAGSDYQFQNDNYLCQDTGCDRPGEAARRVAADALTHDASLVMTVPMAGYVAADESGGGDVRRSGPGYLATRFRVSLPRKGSPFTLTPDPHAATVYQDEFVHWLEATFPAARRDPARTLFYGLDNEPDLWASTHAEVHPAAPRYDEMVTRTTDLAAAIKAAAPGALVFGPVSYGWGGYANLQGAPDAMGRDFLEFYLDAMRAAESRAHQRLVDVLDLHWYPEARGGGQRITVDDASPAVADARMQAPRSLWDPGYTESSWITTDALHAPIRLIPRMRDKIAAHYPGTRLAFTEYNYGGGADISGGVAEADVLGVFGREGVFAAAVWPSGSTDERYLYGAMAMYRNYDGAGGAFGDTSVAVEDTDTVRTSAYASVGAGAGGARADRLVLVVINKSGATVTAGIAVTAPGVLGHAQVWQLTSAAASPRRAADLAAGARNAFRYSLPAHSVSTLVFLP